MAAWFGFSDDDLRKVKTMAKPDSDSSKNGTVEPQKSVVGKKPQASRSRSSLEKPQASRSRSSLEKPQASRSRSALATSTILFGEVDKAMSLQKSASGQTNEGHSHRIPKEHKEMATDKDVEKPSEGVSSKKDAEAETVVESLNDKEGFDRDMMSLEKFRTQQKAIEEANKQKKALLSKTITERRKAAVAEAHKMEHIQRELGKLDQMLTVDVQVIRNKIEETSRDYMDAEKRFQRAEAEYIAAKMDLHEKCEHKEQLTEHMYTIIQQNEVRKARKLQELMLQMEMEATEDDLQLPELPPLSSFQQTVISPTGLKHVVKRQSSVEAGEKTSKTDNSNVAGSEEKSSKLDNSNVAGSESSKLDNSNVAGSESSKLDNSNVAGTEEKSSKLDNSNVAGSESSKTDNSNASGTESSKLDNSNVAGSESSKLDNSNVAGSESSKLDNSNVAGSESSKLDNSNVAGTEEKSKTDNSNASGTEEKTSKTDMSDAAITTGEKDIKKKCTIDKAEDLKKTNIVANGSIPVTDVSSVTGIDPLATVESKPGDKETESQESETSVHPDNSKVTDFGARVKQDSVSDSGKVTPGGNTVRSGNAVKSEGLVKTEPVENKPKVPSKWDFDGVVS